MNILIFGLGSVGQRHLRNIKKLNKNTNVYVIRKKYLTPSLDNNNKIINQNLKKNLIYIISKMKKR